jgi:hypothetical protein
MLFLASYKGTQPGLAGLVNRAIRFVTKSQYSHTEICLGDPFASPVDCLSSAHHEGGVRVKHMQLSPAKWDVIALPHVSEGAYLHFLANHHGQPYDFIGCARSVLPFVRGEHPRKWFCSEVSAAIIGHAEPWRMHPGVLHMITSQQTSMQGNTA